MRIALVHDYLVQYGGAERVLECFSEIFPYAPIYTLIYSKELMRGKFSKKNIQTSFIQKIPLAALAVLLVYTGYKLASPKVLVETYRKGDDQFLIFLTTLVASLSQGFLVGISV